MEHPNDKDDLKNTPSGTKGISSDQTLSETNQFNQTKDSPDRRSPGDTGSKDLGRENEKRGDENTPDEEPVIGNS